MQYISSIYSFIQLQTEKDNDDDEDKEIVMRVLEDIRKEYGGLSEDQIYLKEREIENSKISSQLDSSITQNVENKEAGELMKERLSEMEENYEEMLGKKDEEIGKCQDEVERLKVKIMELLEIIKKKNKDVLYQKNLLGLVKSGRSLSKSSKLLKMKMRNIRKKRKKSVDNDDGDEEKGEEEMGNEEDSEEEEEIGEEEGMDLNRTLKIIQNNLVKNSISEIDSMLDMSGVSTLHNTGLLVDALGKFNND